MTLPDVKENWTGRINRVSLGATAAEGGTRGSTVTIGGAGTLPFMDTEGALPNRPAVAGYVSDIAPDWPDTVKNAVGPETGSPAEWAEKNVKEFGTDLISLSLNGADPSGENRTPEVCAQTVADILKAVDVPLVIWGCGDDEKDNQVLQECSHAAKGENCLIGAARETNYKTVVAICKADGHKIITEAPVDINIGKQVNILVQDAGFDLRDVVMHQVTAALGYGLDYVYSILERCRLSGLRGDKLLAAPIVCNVAQETYRVKEAVAGEDALPGWGDAARRGMLWETVCAGNYLQAGADLLVLAHPEAITGTKNLIDDLS